MKKRILITFFVSISFVSLVALLFTFRQVEQEKERLISSLEQRSILLAESLRETIEPNFINKSDAQIQKLVRKFTDRERLVGLAVYDNRGALVATSTSLEKNIAASPKIASFAMDADASKGEFASIEEEQMYFLAIPLHDETSVVGALMIVQNTEYIGAQLAEIWETNLLRLFFQTLLIIGAILFVLRWLIYGPLQRLVFSLRSVRIGGRFPDLESGSSLFKPLTREFVSMRQSLLEARMAAREEARTNLEKLDSPWTSERLREFVNQILHERKIVVVSLSEPYNHVKNGNDISTIIPAGGLVTAIEPIMQACGGTWIAAGGRGDADRIVVDAHDRVGVPPDEPKYTLRRVWLPEEDARRNSAGFCNEGMWALFHQAYNRPIFRKEDWEAYKKVNGKFAEVVLEEIKDLKRPLIFIQDFQFTLLPSMLKKARPDATVGVFWHIPWVSPESFSICPWKKEILRGMLGADMLGFHIPLHCNNFIESVNRELESLIDYGDAIITHEDHTTFIKPFPVSVAFYNHADDQGDIKQKKEEREHVLKEFGVTCTYIGMGAERLDYTKGILERLTGIEIFLEKYPQYRGDFTFIQIASPSRTATARYRQLAEQVQEEVERINALFQTRNWKPIIYLNRYHTHEEINRIYRIANVCLVTSLHDGMNLVAKEFVAARSDEKGVLILSQFAGAARELKDALIINPYNGEQTAEAIHAALAMPFSEQMRRMKKLRETVRNYNVYRWAAEYLKTMVSIE